MFSELGFKPLNFSSATLHWAIWSRVNPECSQNYTVLVQSVHTPGIFHNITTSSTSLNVTGLIRGEEYTVTVSTAHSKKTVKMTLEGVRVILIFKCHLSIFCLFVLAVADGVIDLSVEIMMLNSREFILQVSWKVMQMKSNLFMICKNVFVFLIYSNPLRPVLQCYNMWLHTM